MQMEMMNVKTYVLGRDSGGSSDFFETDVSLSRSSYDLGEHYDVAIKRAEEAGYETPMGAFDEFDPAGKALARLQSMQTVEAIGRNVPTVLVWLGEGGVEELIADFRCATWLSQPILSMQTMTVCIKSTRAMRFTKPFVIRGSAP